MNAFFSFKEDVNRVFGLAFSLAGGDLDRLPNRQFQRRSTIQEIRSITPLLRELEIQGRSDLLHETKPSPTPERNWSSVTLSAHLESTGRGHYRAVLYPVRRPTARPWLVSLEIDGRRRRNAMASSSMAPA